MIAGALGSFGALNWVARDQELSSALDEFFRAGFEDFGCVGQFISIAGLPAYFKAEPMGGRARWRHYLRKNLLARPYPRLAEFENLRWLADHGFAVAEPLAAGVRHRWNGIDWQFLMTLRFEGSEPLLEPGQLADGERLGALAGEVARMHDLGFIHRDLHLRNLVWRREASGPRVLFYDAWRGGARLQSRGISYDVACLTQGLAWEAGEPCADQFLELYLARRGPGVNLARLRSRVAGERKRLQVRQARPWAASPPSVE